MSVTGCRIRKKNKAEKQFHRCYQFIEALVKQDAKPHNKQQFWNEQLEDPKAVVFNFLLQLSLLFLMVLVQ